jgi:hypothetical protein
VVEVLVGSREQARSRTGRSLTTKGRDEEARPVRGQCVANFPP